MPTPDVRHDDLSLESKVALLRRPESWPENPAKIEERETHMSWVFLTPQHAYKLKKPVRYDFLDFSTLELRQHDSAEEVRPISVSPPRYTLASFPWRWMSTDTLRWKAKENRSNGW